MFALVLLPVLPCDLAVPGAGLAAVEVAAAVALGAAVHLPGVPALNMQQVTFNIIKNLCQSVHGRFCIRQINLVLNIEEGWPSNKVC